MLLRCSALAGELCIAPFIAELLLRRGFAICADASRFLDPRLKTLGDPFTLPDMERAVERILSAIDRHERIVLYGDYDVDGVTSLAFLSRLLNGYGAQPRCFLPLRMDEGYGLSEDGVKRCVETLEPATAHSRLTAALRRSRRSPDCGNDGVDTIVIDHHEIKGALPECVALVNPKRGDTHHYLCSVGLSLQSCARAAQAASSGWLRSARASSILWLSAQWPIWCRWWTRIACWSNTVSRGSRRRARSDCGS
jgi:single-stranded-DNA-specific exonuclease